MPDSRKHRGKHPSDEKLFSGKQIITLSEAMRDINYLLSRGYNFNASISLVGNRYKLLKRQRLAISYSACDIQSLRYRKQHEISASSLGPTLAIDGYNYLITMESALSGAYIFEGTDGCYRDISGIHGNYRKITETGQALTMTGHFLEDCGINHCIWYLDQPVSNSGKLKSYINEIAKKNGWNWEVALSYNPDKELIEKDFPVVSGDSFILNKCNKWLNLTKEVLEKNNYNVNLIHFNNDI